MSGKLLTVIRREYLERVRSKAFIIATVLGPVLMGAMMVVPMLVAKSRAGSSLLRVAVVDQTGELGAAVEQALRIAVWEGKPRFDVRPGEPGTPEEREKLHRDSVLKGELDGFLVLPDGALGAAKADYFGRNVSNQMDIGLLRKTVNDLLVSRRLSGAGIDPDRVKELTRGLDLRTVRLSKAGEREDKGAAVVFSVVLLMILYTSILMWGQSVMTGVIEEKTNRVVEVVLSGLSATELLAGKLLGVGAAGLTQFGVWALSLFGVSLAMAGPGAASAFKMPEVSLLVLVSFVLFFLLGFAFYAALYAAVGAAVNNLQEAQNFVLPIVLPLVIGIMFFPIILESPDGPLAVVLSLIPFLTPLLMFLRIVVLTPPTWQIVLSFGFMVAAISGVIWFAARIYRVGILMYGKRPTFPELIRWARRS